MERGDTEKWRDGRAGGGQERRRTLVRGGNWKHMRRSDCCTPRPHPHPPAHHLIQTTAHNKDGRWAKNGVRADCEGGDTWAVFCCSLAVFLWKKDGNWQTLNKCRWHSVLCIMWGFQAWCVYELLKMDSIQTKQVIIGWKTVAVAQKEHYINKS